MKRESQASLLTCSRPLCAGRCYLQQQLTSEGRDSVQSAETVRLAALDPVAASVGSERV